jgi:predicted Zn-dependent peptidase
VISILAFALAAPSVAVIEMPDPAAQNIRIAVSIAAPYELKDREQAAWRLLPRLVLQGTQEYSRASIYDVSLQGGRLPVASGGPDIVRIEISAPAGGVNIVAGVIESILTKPRFRPEDLEAARRELKNRQGGPFAELLDPARPSLDKASVELCRSLWLQACRPERISIVVSGKFEPGEGVKAFEGRIKPDPAPSRGSLVNDQPAPELKYHLKPLTSFELAAEPINFKDLSAGPRLLAVHALGAGKESTVYRVLREQAGLSYEQRAILWPTAKGWVPRIYLLRRAEEGDGAVLERMIQLLEADVATWTEADLERAKAMATAALDGLPVDNLFWVDESGPISNNVEDDCTLRAFMAMAGAPEWNRNRLKLAMSQVNLERLKAAAADIVKTAKSRVIPGLR